MPKILEPIRIEERTNFLKNLEKNIKSKISKDDYRTFLNSPVVYIHSWKTSENNYSFYVGEANDIIKRTNDHYKAGKKPGEWQVGLLQNHKSKFFYLIANEHFNKSFTMDFENKMIQFATANDKYIKKVLNSRGNPQNYDYYPCEEFNDTFNEIYDKLTLFDDKLFLKRSEIESSAIFKASPLHKLTEVQENVQRDIVDRVSNFIINNSSSSTNSNARKNELIVVEGEAGTGKSVLVSSTFYKIIDYIAEFGDSDLKCYLIVNHNEQLKVYKDIFKRLNVPNFKDIIKKPTSFINKCNEDINLKNEKKIVFIDEAHLLLTEGKQSYKGKNQLDDIRSLSDMTIIMYDECQCLSFDQYLGHDEIKKMREEARQNGNLLELKNQLRIQASDNTIDWIKDFCNLNLKDELILNKDNKDDKGYEVRLFDDIFDFENKIIKRNNELTLCRMIATYDRDYNKKNYRVEINENGKTWSKVWNYKYKKGGKKDYKYKDSAWAEKPYTINEVGSLYTIQGFDLNYAAVIIGKSIIFKDGKICVDKNNSCNKNALKKRESKYDLSDILIKNELGILLKRSVKGLYLYICDKDLRNEVKKYIKIEK